MEADPSEVPDRSPSHDARPASPSSVPARTRKGVGTKRRADNLQESGAVKRPNVEEGDDFLLNEISLAARDLGLPEFTWRGEPLSPLNPIGETRVGSGASRESPPTTDAPACGEGVAEAIEVPSTGARAENIASDTEVDLQGEGSERCTPPDPSANAAADGSSEETPVPSTSGAGFDFMGIRLLGDPLEALASVLPDDLFRDVGRTTPFKFAQDIVESQIAVHSSCVFSSLFFSLVVSNLFLRSRILSDPSQHCLTSWNTCETIPT
jgi:hypothetical protein